MKPKTNLEKATYVLAHKPLDEYAGFELWIVRFAYNTDLELNTTGHTILDHLYLSTLGEQGEESGLPTEQDLEPALESPPDEEITNKEKVIFIHIFNKDHNILMSRADEALLQLAVGTRDEVLDSRAQSELDDLYYRASPTTPEVSSSGTKKCTECNRTFPLLWLCPDCMKKNASKSTPEISSLGSEECTECHKTFRLDQLYKQAGMKVCAKCLKVMDP